MIELESYNGLEYLDANPQAERVALALHWGWLFGARWPTLRLITAGLAHHRPIVARPRA